MKLLNLITVLVAVFLMSGSVAQAQSNSNYQPAYSSPYSNPYAGGGSAGGGSAGGQSTQGLGIDIGIGIGGGGIVIDIGGGKKPNGVPLDTEAWVLMIAGAAFGAWRVWAANKKKALQVTA